MHLTFTFYAIRGGKLCDEYIKWFAKYGWFLGILSPLLLVWQLLAYPYNHGLAPFRYLFHHIFGYIRQRLNCWPLGAGRKVVSKLKTAGRINEKSTSHIPDHRLPFELVIMICQELHYVDLVNLSLSSKTLSERFLGRERHWTRLDALRRYTCGQQLSKSNCGICSNQICSVSPSLSKRSVRRPGMMTERILGLL